MRYVIYGAGAIGGVLGARLFSAGFDATVIARGPHLEAIRRNGLRVDSPDGTETVPVPAVAAPDDVGIAAGDVVILAMKTQDTGAALAALRDSADPATAIVCLQNGVENERMALRSFEHVYGVCVMFPATHTEPGVVQSQSTPIPGLLDIGRYPHGADDTAEQVAAAFRKASFVSEVREDIMRWKYRKLMMNLTNAVQALCGTGEEARPLVERIRAEGLACLQAAGIDVASEAEETARRGDLLQVRPVAGQTRTGGSSWQSLHRGTGAIEADYLNGEIVLLGRIHGVPTPANEAVRRLANSVARERGRPGSVPVQQILDALPRQS
ncbi:ketopantoate reductase family protein [Phytoactinopolyspora halotolerans]|uniref:2-dehydropantoate 2-reductase n=1 Tax=Phytoactinopolyspora halotolerans TaxID=1981512 RepID=A0A6L9S652_9ACTN|nr:ketopantoate reductase family protein [Phytoactinopolyspora halotolerans]NEE00549.1 ketopantoate reductase family protein [Phytoactinopolyspora halotolerans]